jgi:hypothetical protein
MGHHMCSMLIKCGMYYFYILFLANVAPPLGFVYFVDSGGAAGYATSRCPCPLQVLYGFSSGAEGSAAVRASVCVDHFRDTISNEVSG